jgi:hypothetical protein
MIAQRDYHGHYHTDGNRRDRMRVNTTLPITVFCQEPSEVVLRESARRELDARRREQYLCGTVAA